MFKNAEAISSELLNSFEEEVKNDNSAQILKRAANKNNLKSLVYEFDNLNGLEDNFSINLKTLPITNQKSSGRCWIFAALNLLREFVGKKCNLSKFELSQNYIAFYDKLEKINYALESCIDFISLEHDERVVSHIVSYPVGDGGQWDMFKSLVKKYGVVPKNVMQESFTSSNTREHNYLVNTTIRKFAATAHHLHEEGRDREIRPLKNKVLKELYRSLEIVFGTPVKVFDFEYTDKDGVYHIDKNLTPKTFYDKYVGINIDDYVSIINSPTKDKPFFKTFTLDYVGNVIGDAPIKHLNLPMENIKRAVISTLKDNEPVWFGSDCSKCGTEDGLWAPELFNYELLFNLDIDMTKEDQLDYYQSAMNHAMLLVGVNLDNEIPTKWKIENSWGKDRGIDGFYTASDEWFNRYVFQVVVNKKYLTEEERKALDLEPIHLAPWDPMGTLA